jgi:hypothetical protein
MSLTNTSSFSLSTFLFMPQGEWEGGSAAHFGGGGSLGNITTKIHIKHGSHREKGRNCVFFMYKMLCPEYVRMQDFASNFQKFGGLFKFKSDLFNKNEVKTLRLLELL